MTGAGKSVTEIKRRGLLLVLSSPSGAGKTTITRRLLDSDGNLDLSVSVTTRPPRPKERDGVDYHFIDEPTFHRMAQHGELLEHAHVFGNYYGTPKAPVEQALTEGRDVIFDVDWQGAQQIRESAPKDFVSVFILPPGAEELERRLRARGQDSDEVIANRMSVAGKEIIHFAEYQYVLVNRDIDYCQADVEAILRAERLRLDRQMGLRDFVAGLNETLG